MYGRLGDDDDNHGTVDETLRASVIITHIARTARSTHCACAICANIKVSLLLIDCMETL